MISFLKEYWYLAVIVAMAVAIVWLKAEATSLRGEMTRIKADAAIELANAQTKLSEETRARELYEASATNKDATIAGLRVQIAGSDDACSRRVDRLSAELRACRERKPTVPGTTKTGKSPMVVDDETSAALIRRMSSGR